MILPALAGRASMTIRIMVDLLQPRLRPWKGARDSRARASQHQTRQPSTAVATGWSDERLPRMLIADPRRPRRARLRNNPQLSAHRLQCVRRAAGRLALPSLGTAPLAAGSDFPASRCARCRFLDVAAAIPWAVATAADDARAWGQNLAAGAGTVPGQPMTALPPHFRPLVITASAPAMAATSFNCRLAV
jgi:hypothetical protein